MPRRGHLQKRENVPDPIYQSPLVTRFINCLMTDGKKSVAEQIFYGAMTIVQDKTSEDPVKIFRKAIDNVKPALEVKSRRVGGSNYQVPVEVRPERRTALAIRWMITYSRGRSEKSMRERLANEVLDASAILCVSSFFLNAPPRSADASRISFASLSRIDFSVRAFA